VCRSMNKTGDIKLFYRHIITASCFSIQAIGVGAHISFGVFFNPLITEFGWSRATISGASSMAFFLMGLLSIFVGRLNDRVGPRIIMTITGIFYGLGLLLMSRLGFVWQLYLFYGVVVGIGLSSIDVVALTTIARWFDKKRGMMTGIVKVGTGAGYLICPIVASLLISNYGWRTTYIIIGSAVLIILVSIAQLLKRDPSTLRPVEDLQTTKVVCEPNPADEGFSLSEVLYTRHFWTICIANLVFVFCAMIVVVHIIPHARDIKISVTNAASILSVIGGASIFSRIATGIAIDRIGSKKVMIFCFLLLTIALFWLSIAGSLWALYLFAVIYGLAHGGIFTVISPMVAEFFGISSHGIILGVVVFAGNLGGSVSPIVAGLIFDATGGYGPVYGICLLMIALGLALLISLPSEPSVGLERR
jgi:MFS family permease